MPDALELNRALGFLTEPALSPVEGFDMTEK